MLSLSAKDSYFQNSGSSHESLQQQIRSSLSQFVTTCELLKMEAQDVNEPLFCRQVDALRERALTITQHCGRVEENDAANGGANGKVRESATDLLNAIAELQANTPSVPGVEWAEDILRLDFIAHHLSRLIQRTAQPVRSNGSNPDAQNGAGAFSQPTSTVMVVDDDDQNRDLLSRLIRHDHYDIVTASSGAEALQRAGSSKLDLVLLDLVMPGLNGFEVLRALKNKESTNQVPVIMVSGVDDIEGISTCLESGAEDYVLKPFNATILRARLKGTLERKRARDLERTHALELQAAIADLEKEKRRTEELLLNLLPQSAAEELRQKGAVSPMHFEDVTIVFTDFVSFTSSTEKLSAEELVGLLNDYFTAFDQIVDRYQLEKLKTVGDSYMFVSGIPHRHASHAVDAVLASMDMLEFVRKRLEQGGKAWDMRVGIHNGPVVAGVVGTRKFAFDIWGDAVNFASRMVSSGGSNRINVSERTYQRLKDFFTCSARGSVPIKGNRMAEMYFVDGIISSLLEDTTGGPSPAFRARYRNHFRREFNFSQ